MYGVEWGGGQSESPRGQAWAERSLIQAASIATDGDPEKPYFLDLQKVIHDAYYDVANSYADSSYGSECTNEVSSDVAALFQTGYAVSSASWAAAILPINGANSGTSARWTDDCLTRLEIGAWDGSFVNSTFYGSTEQITNTTFTVAYVPGGAYSGSTGLCHTSGFCSFVTYFQNAIHDLEASTIDATGLVTMSFNGQDALGQYLSNGDKIQIWDDPGTPIQLLGRSTQYWLYNLTGVGTTATVTARLSTTAPPTTTPYTPPGSGFTYPVSLGFFAWWPTNPGPSTGPAAFGYGSTDGDYVNIQAAALDIYLWAGGTETNASLADTNVNARFVESPKCLYEAKWCTDGTIRVVDPQ